MTREEANAVLELMLTTARTSLSETEIEAIRTVLKEQEAVVLCKDCVNRHNSINCKMYSEGMDTPDYWFCADGELKEEWC